MFSLLSRSAAKVCVYRGVLMGLFLLILGFTGCLEEYAIRVNNTQVATVGRVLTEYVGMNGYKLNYGDPLSGNYRIHFSESYEQGDAESHEEKEEVTLPGPKNNYTRNVTVTTPGDVTHHIYYLNLHLTQQGSDVKITGECNDGFTDEFVCDADKIKSFMQFLQSKGFSANLQVE
jgi:hypothetical protein